MTGSNLAVSGKAAWFGTSTAGASMYLWATADGVHWRKYPFSCPADLGLGGIAAASGWQVAFLCGASEGTYHSAKEVLLLVNSGRTEHLTGQAQVAGDVAGFAVPPSRATVITITVVTPGLSYLYRSANGGKTRAEIAVSSLTGEVSFTSLSYVSPTAGIGTGVGPAARGGRSELGTISITASTPSGPDHRRRQRPRNRHHRHRQPVSRPACSASAHRNRSPRPRPARTRPD